VFWNCDFTLTSLQKVTRFKPQRPDEELGAQVPIERAVADALLFQRVFRGQAEPNRFASGFVV
jgi:hypothetical protein